MNAETKRENTQPLLVYVVGKDIFVNKRTGHTITDENMIPKEDKQSTYIHVFLKHIAENLYKQFQDFTVILIRWFFPPEAVSETSGDKQCRRFVKKTSTCSPSITASIRTMIEDHFDVDDEMTSVKWKDKEALKNDQGYNLIQTLCCSYTLHCM